MVSPRTLPVAATSLRWPFDKANSRTGLYKNNERWIGRCHMTYPFVHLTHCLHYTGCAHASWSATNMENCYQSVVLSACCRKPQTMAYCEQAECKSMLLNHSHFTLLFLKLGGTNKIWLTMTSEAALVGLPPAPNIPQWLTKVCSLLSNRVLNKPWVLVHMPWEAKACGLLLPASGGQRFSSMH